LLIALKIPFGHCSFAGACESDDADENNIRVSGWFFKVDNKFFIFVQCPVFGGDVVLLYGTSLKSALK
jgi:hypothetical protein